MNLQRLEKRFYDSRGVDEETEKTIMNAEWILGERVGTYRPMIGSAIFQRDKIDYILGKGVPYVQFELDGSFMFLIYDEAFLDQDWKLQ